MNYCVDNSHDRDLSAIIVDWRMKLDSDQILCG